MQRLARRVVACIHQMEGLLMLCKRQQVVRFAAELHRSDRPACLQLCHPLHKQRTVAQLPVCLTPSYCIRMKHLLYMLSFFGYA
jgi:hypothetical protein